MQYKYLEALARLRVMTGDDSDSSVDDAMMASMLDRTDDDGLIYSPPRSVGHFEWPPDTACHIALGRTVLTFSAWYARDGDPAWLDRMSRLVQGLDRMAIRRSSGDGAYAFYPSEAGLDRASRWIANDRDWDSPGSGFFPYTPPDEPAREQQGREGTVKADQGNVIRGLMEYFRVTGEEPALELAQQLTRFCLLASLWDDGHQWGIQGHERGLWAGHFHGQALAFRGMLDVAIATHDEDLKNLVRAAYEHGCRIGLRRLGWFPAYAVPERFGRPTGWHSISETCAIHDMIALAIALSEAGVGDYWDDVDHFTRNQLLEQQLVDRELMEDVARRSHDLTPDHGGAQALPEDRSEGALLRMVGSFSQGTPASLGRITGFGPAIGIAGFGCCTGNGALSLFQVWDAIVRHRDGVTTVNLLMDRISPWVDVHSDVPVAGRVHITVKAATDLAVRIPGWVALDQVSVAVDGEPSPTRFVGRHVMVPRVVPGQEVEVGFAVPRSDARYDVRGQTYTCHFHGSTAVSVHSDNNDEGPYPLYRRHP